MTELKVWYKHYVPERLNRTLDKGIMATLHHSDYNQEWLKRNLNDNVTATHHHKLVS